MAKSNNTDTATRELVEEIDAQERRPVKCDSCGAIAGTELLADWVDPNELISPWVCRDCRGGGR